MMCDSSVTRLKDSDVRLNGQVVIKKDTFRYLGPYIRTETSMKMLDIEFQPVG